MTIELQVVLLFSIYIAVLSMTIWPKPVLVNWIRRLWARFKGRFLIYGKPAVGQYYAGMDFGSEDKDVTVIGHMEDANLIVIGTLSRKNKDGTYDWCGDTITSEAMKDMIEQFNKGTKTGRFNTKQLNHSNPPRSLEGILMDDSESAIYRKLTDKEKEWWTKPLTNVNIKKNEIMVLPTVKVKQP